MKLEIGDQVVFRGTATPVMRVEAINSDGTISVGWLSHELDRYAHETYSDGRNLTLAEPIMQWFRYRHLPDHLQAFSKMFAALASDIMETLPDNPERTVALRKLLEAKDAGVRAALYES